MRKNNLHRTGYFFIFFCTFLIFTIFLQNSFAQTSENINKEESFNNNIQSSSNSTKLNTNKFIKEVAFTNPLQQDEVLEVEYIFDQNVNDLHFANIFYIFITTTERKYSFYVLIQHGEQTLYFYPHLFDGQIIEISIELPLPMVQTFSSVDNALRLKFSRYKKTNFYETWNTAIPVSVQDILHWRKTGSNNNLAAFGLGFKEVVSTLLENETKNSNFVRDGDVFRWQSYKNAFVFFFDSDKQQSNYFKRLAFFVEKKGFRNKMLNNEELKNKFGWGAHDYKSDDLARFFETARLEQVSLNEYEYKLKQMLIDFGLLINTDFNITDISNIPVVEGEGYIASISRSYNYALQSVLLTHELMHTWFFDNEELRILVSKLWNESSDNLKQSWKLFLSLSSYDPNFQYLVENEFFTYLLQRPLPNLSWYAPLRFVRGNFNEEQTKELTDEFVNIASVLNTYIGKTYGAQAGFVQYIVEF